MATVYHRDQAGAPGLVYSTSGNSIAHFTALKEILKACLVNGYGGRPAAGWSLINEGSDFIVLRNGTESGYVCLSWATAVVTVYLAETYTGMNGRVMMGAGLKTGTAASNGVPHRFGTFGLAYSSAGTSWYMVADQRTFVLGCGFYPSDSDFASGDGALTLYAGEDLNGNVIAIGGLNTTTSSASSYTSPETEFGAAAFTALRDPATGLLVDSGSLAVTVPGLNRWSTTAGNFQTSSILLGEVCLAPAAWCGGGVYVGRLRGIAMIPLLTLTANATIAAASLGFPGTLTTRTANTPLDLGDGSAYFARMAHAATAFFLVTDNPEFW